MPDFRTPRNTTADMRDPVEQMLFLGEAMARGNSAPILDQEQQGQAQLVHSDVIPSDLHGQEDVLTALGFVLGDPVEGDPMFRQATLPDGWKREGSDHAMWSYLVDELGRRRVSVFYKAAFYDRSANASVASLQSYLGACLYDSAEPVLDEAWATKERVLEALTAIRVRVEESLALWTRHDDAERMGHYQGEIDQVDALKARVEALI